MSSSCTIPLARATETPAWRSVESVEQTVAAYPERIEALLAGLDLDRPELARVATARRRGDAEGACEALLDHYRKRGRIDWLRTPRGGDPRQREVERADTILADVYFGFGDRGEMPRTDNRHIDWSHEGPNGDRQFKLRVNRHGHLRLLMQVYLSTGEEKYLHRLDMDLRDWLIAAEGAVVPWDTVHLEPALRLPVWATLFYGLQGETHFHDSTRLLLLAAIPEHAEHLLTHTGGGNWVAMTQKGAITAGVCWPEFKRAEHWRGKGFERLHRNAQRTVYPDGAQQELTAGYHMVTLHNYEAVANGMRRAGFDVPADFAETAERMWNYIVQTLRPDGRRPLNNDSDSGSEERGARRAAEVYDRPDWLYIVSNGQEGGPPEGVPSRFFPWAGHLISRSGWDANAHWSFFDVGPSGLGGHWHLDHGHLSITAFGRDLLVDSGRFAYQGRISRFRRPYAMHTRGHNTLLIDGQEQGRDPDIVAEPIPKSHWRIATESDFARGTWSDFPHNEGTLRHHRSLLYLRGEGWIVVDRIETDRPRTIEALWHFHPENTVKTEGNSVSTHNETGNLDVSPLGDIEWDLRLVKGQTDPHFQGWYSSTYGSFEEAPCAVYKGRIEGTATFAWRLWPAAGAPTPPAARLLRSEGESVRVQIGEHTLDIPITDTP